MNWQDDPELQRQKYHAGVRGRLFRSSLIWTPPFLASLAALLFFTYDRAFRGGETGGTWFLVVVLAVFTTLFGFQAVQSLLDLLGKPVTRQGTVTRRWARSDSFVIRSHYMRLDKMILRGDIMLLDPIKEGDYVEATYYPKSAVLTWVEKVERPADLPETVERAAQRKPSGL